MDVEKTLSENSLLLKELEKEQYLRLSSKPANNEPNLEPPTAQEQKIAEKLQQGLTNLTGAVTPVDVCNQSAVRKAMGVDITL